jgi:hypothetical protein
MKPLCLLLLLLLTITNASAQIAYVRGGTEIRLIEPDGTNDRRLWTHPDARPELGIYGLAWRPDHKELAFSSGHASAASLFHSDLYAIRAGRIWFSQVDEPAGHQRVQTFS